MMTFSKVGFGVYVKLAIANCWVVLKIYGNDGRREAPPIIVDPVTVQNGTIIE
jgi:hypothetical protein